MIKIGDKVKFLNDVGGGIVTSFINKNMVNVENEDGFEIPYPINQLVNVNAPELVRGGKDQSPKVAELPIVPQTKSAESSGIVLKGKESPDFYFCFVPTDSSNPLSEEIELYLVNDSNFTLMYQYFHRREERMQTIKFGNVLSNSKILLGSLVRNDLNELPEFGFQLMFFKESDKGNHEPFTKTFKINPVKFYKETSFHSNDLFEKNALILQITRDILNTDLDKLSQDDFKKVVRAKEAVPRQKLKVKTRKPEIVEVDLHINELLDSAEGLSNREILGIQMDRVDSEMRDAIQSGARKIVFIHGVGQGVLKQEIANLLKSKFKKYYFQDASFKEYGYGATMVTLRKG